MNENTWRTQGYSGLPAEHLGHDSVNKWQLLTILQERQSVVPHDAIDLRLSPLLYVRILGHRVEERRHS